MSVRTRFAGALAAALLPALACAQSGGLPPVWEIRKFLEEFSAEVRRLKPILDQVNPGSWPAEGAAAFTDQWKAARNEVDHTLRSVEILSEKPDKLPAVLEVHFRVQALESMLLSLAGGVRRYQNPAVAQLLTAVLGENAANRDKLRQYLTDLAAAKEEELAAMDREAQRCRQLLMRPPVQPRPAPRPAPKETQK